MRVLPLLVALAAGCSTGGGATSRFDNNPTLLSVTFLGAGATPVAGDTLQLLLTEPLNLVAGTTFDAADLTITNGTLGTVTATPALASPNVIELTLGAGVSLTPGVTTIEFALANDAVRDVTGRLAIPGTPRMLKKGDAEDPVISAITLNGIAVHLNGTGAAGGTLQVAHTGFTIDITYSDATSGVDAAMCIVRSTTQVAVLGNQLTVGENLVPHLSVVGTSATAVSYSVPSAVGFPKALITLTCQVVDTTGRASAPFTFRFLSKTLEADERPFESGQVWFIDMSRDLESFSVDLANTVTPVVVVPGVSGKSDSEELLTIAGLNSATPIANVLGSDNSNTVVLDKFKTEILARLAALHTQTSVTFTFTKPGVWPSGPVQIIYSGLSFSQICLAGMPTSSGLHGLALFDPKNARQDNDCAEDSGGQRLGMFLHTVINSGFLSSPASTFRVQFDQFITARGGTPIGNDASDDGRLNGTLTDARATAITVAIRDLARFCATVLAHECGHSEGLVQSGSMPAGLYGNDPVHFVGSTDGHIAMALFTNIMGPTIGYDGGRSTATVFNSLNLAYLRERVLYDQE